MSNADSTTGGQPREIITRAEARERGLKHYFTGKACARGHIVSRFSSNGGCIACAAASGAAWVQKNPEQTKAKLSRYYRKNSAAKREKAADWRRLNRERCLLTQKAWVEKNPEKARRMRSATYERHKEKIRSGQALYRATDAFAALNRALTSKRRAILRSAMPCWFDEIDAFVMAEAAHLAVLRGSATGIAWHVDHMIPLGARDAKGLHCAANLQVIPASLNAHKKNKMILTERGEWLKHL